VLAQSCSPVHLIVARGSFEKPGEGLSASLSTAIKRAVPGATSEALDYPAIMPYKDSMPIGTANMKKAIARYTQTCPQSKLILIGYSQGGSVVIDTLCGGGHPEIGPHTDGITKEQGQSIKLALSFGEPRFLPGMPYCLGTNSKSPGVSNCASETRREYSFSSSAFSVPRCALGIYAIDKSIAICPSSRRRAMSQFFSGHKILVRCRRLTLCKWQIYGSSYELPAAVQRYCIKICSRCY
jgi:cutinase